MGQAKLVKKEWLKQGTVVIDVEMNRDKNGKLCGDVELNDVMEKFHISRLFQKVMDL